MKTTPSAVLVLMASPLAALAQSQATEPSFADKFLTPGGIALILSVLGTLLGAVLGGRAVMKRRVALAIRHAYAIVEDIDRERGDAKLDKAAEGLRQANAWMIANGWRTLTPDEEVLARLQFQAIHGSEAQAAKVLAEAQSLKVAPIPFR